MLSINKSGALFTFLLAVTQITAQEKVAIATYPNETITVKHNAATAKQYLIATYKEQLKNTDLVLDYERKSIAANHYNFIQTFDGIKILDSEIKISISKMGKVVSIHNNLLEQSEIENFKIDYSEPKVVIESAMKIWNEENVLISKENSFSIAKKLLTTTKNGIGHELIFDANGMYRDRITSCFFLPDSNVTGRVFDPDPLTTANAVYGASYRDFNDGDSAIVHNAQRKLKTFTTHFNGNVFELKNDFIELQDLDGDLTPVATSLNGDFNFTRSETGFEDVNAFYHISKMQKHIASLGFNTALQKVFVDPHGGSFDNSYFTVPASLYFGTGGVDDAEDADVLVHEYTHFISYNAAPNSNIGNERNALDEGTCDYMAASYSKYVNSFNWQWVYNWDGHNEFWNGRVVSTSKVYPANKVNNIYRDGEMWSSTLMEIYDDLGRNTTDSLVLETMYQFAPNMTFEMAANALLRSDTLLANGKYFCTIYRHLLNRGFLTFRQNSCGISSINEIKEKPVELINTPNGFVIRNMSSDVKINSIKLINTSGQLVRNIANTSFYDKYEIASGIYLISIETNQGNYTLKWANY
jgi:Zn-dependent metalloprotease